ncbi:replication initiator protein A [Leuconostoc mesenteroides]|uniref:replication initiator protein A n=1 Tax=Leuconostoc mesenteroides TaxID=1245 RepID=UPI0023611B0E|nr:replication initiator protein A [Leuconostoc mesenteroides]
MTEFNFIQSKNAYGTKFFQLPQVLLYGEKYKKLSDSAKLGYVVLRDRLEYSLQNNWIDDEDRVYFIFTNQELNDLFGWGKTKISKIKKELEEAGLLFQVKQAFDPKKMKNLPNRLYLADLEVTAKDVYIKQDFANKTAETLDTSGQPQMGPRLKTAETLDTSGQPQMRHNLDNTNYLDTNRDYKETAQLDFSTANFSNAQIEKQNQDLVLHAKEFLTTEDSDGIPFEPETIKLLSLWANNPKQIRKFIGIILNARRDVQELHKDRHLFFILDEEPELQTKITQTLRRYFNALRSDDKQIKNYENYLYITMRNMFENYGSSKLQREYKLEHSTDQIAKNNLSMDLGTEYLS